jgi:hypothetical protein
MNISLFTLTDQFRELERIGTYPELDDAGLEAVLNTMDGLEIDIKEKATQVAYHIANIEAAAEAAVEMANKLSARAGRVERRAEALREYIRVCMAKAEIKKVEGPHFTIARRDNPPKVTVLDLEKVPDSFRKEYPPIVRAILDAAIAKDQCVQPAPGVPVENIMISVADLQLAIESQLPEPDPDKKKIADALKDYEKSHVAAVVAAQKANTPLPPWVDPVPGCRLDRGERLEIKA